MGITVESTSDGDKIRRDDGKLVGSLGKGKDNLPTVNPVSRDNEQPSNEDMLSRFSYARQHEKLNLKVDPKKVATIDELVSYIVEDMGWSKKEIDSSNVRLNYNWIWNSKERILEYLEYIKNGGRRWEPYSSPDEAFRYEENPYLNKDPKSLEALRVLGYQHYLAQPLPVFVFGTLRPGQGNFGIVRSGQSIQDIDSAKIVGVAMVASKNSGFPMSILAEDTHSMAGDLIYLKQNYGAVETIRYMDNLEGFRSNEPSSSLYNRVAKEVEVYGKDGSVSKVKAWIYITERVDRIRPEDIVKNGDWLEFVNASKNPERRANDLNPELWNQGSRYW